MHDKNAAALVVAFRAQVFGQLEINRVFLFVFGAHGQKPRGFFHDDEVAVLINDGEIKPRFQAFRERVLLA